MFWKKKNDSENVLVMNRKNSDNEYLHKDFHISMNLLLEYIYDKYGKEAVIDYLKRFTRAYHSPITIELSQGYLTALIDYFEDIYGKEGSRIDMEFTNESLVLTIPSCPAVEHILKKGEKLSKVHRYTYETVFETICENTQFEYILDRYNEETGGGIHIFKKREDKE